VNPPAKQKYQFWTGGAPEGELETWLASAQETKGSWWPHWQAWIEAMADERVPARQPGGGVLEVLDDAPGTYVLVRS
jgi:polyhydroxyalkanoate synthase